MYSEANRRETFTSWPHVGYRWAQPDPMAQAGFYHQVKDLVVLSICSLGGRAEEKRWWCFLMGVFFSFFNRFLQLCLNHKNFVIQLFFFFFFSSFRGFWCLEFASFFFFFCMDHRKYCSELKRIKLSYISDWSESNNNNKDEIGCYVECLSPC